MTLPRAPEVDKTAMPWIQNIALTTVNHFTFLQKMNIQTMIAESIFTICFLPSSSAKIYLLETKDSSKFT